MWHLSPVAAGAEPVLAHVHAEVFAAENAWTVASIASLLAMPGVYGYQACGSDQAGVLGFILARAVADEAEILTLAVIAEARRVGVGGALVSAATQAAATLGAECFFLEVAESNIGARRLYEGCGFVLAGRRPSYYQRAGGPEAALLMTCPLSAPRP